jgi:hypothetical protein
MQLRLHCKGTDAGAFGAEFENVLLGLNWHADPCRSTSPIATSELRPDLALVQWSGAHKRSRRILCPRAEGSDRQYRAVRMCPPGPGQTRPSPIACGTPAFFAQHRTRTCGTAVRGESRGKPPRRRRESSQKEREWSCCNSAHGLLMCKVGRKLVSRSILCTDQQCCEYDPAYTTEIAMDVSMARFR